MDYPHAANSISDIQFLFGLIDTMTRPSQMRVIPIKCEARFKRFDLTKVAQQEILRNRQTLRDHDILVVSSKFAAVSEGRFVEMSKVVPSEKAKSLAISYDLSPSLAQLVLEESEEALGGIPGFCLALTNGFLVPNSGIDFSYFTECWSVLYPSDPTRTANRLRRGLESQNTSGFLKKRRLGVILSDSRIAPTRLGTVGVAIAVSGIRSTIDMRGRRDLFEKKLKVTIRGLADQLSSAAEVVMSEADESIPLSIIRGVKTAFETPRNKIEEELYISPKKCLIVAGLENGLRKRLKAGQAFDTSTAKSEIESF